LAKGERSWTASQLSTWLKEKHEVSLTPDWLGRLLKQADLFYKRPYCLLRRKQDKEEGATNREE